MEIQPKQPSTKGPAERFTGDTWFDQLVGGGGVSRIRAAIVHFAPGARNAWHAHALGQTLHVTEGVGRTQVRGGSVIEVQAGDTITAEPGEWHWHGAAPDRFMTHLTIYEAPAEGVETEWGAHVTDAEYLAPTTLR
jgi:quercetin dioxygenase-like cupin family protein